jgi:mono/diheme cytochrome c family protein
MLLPMNRSSSRGCVLSISLLAGVVMVATLAAPVLAQTGQGAARPGPPASKPTAPGLVARGEYLATNVAMCVQCHSGRDRDGNLIESEKFKGGPVPVQSPWPTKQFALQAPNLAGLPGFTDDQILTLLTTGKATGRRAPAPPMPPFRMERADAEAIVAFLRSR